MRNLTVKLFLFLLGTAVLAGCSSLKVIESWNKPSAGKYSKIMIIGVAKDETKRRLYENLVVDELRHHMVTAVASHTMLPELDKTDRAGIAAAVRSAGCDAVLTTRISSINSTSVTQEQPSGDPMGYVFGTHPATSHGDFLKATLQSNLYDTKTAELVWSTTFKTDIANKEARLSRELGRFYFENLSKKGFL